MWEAVPREEQETIINIDYCERTLNLYTNRKSVAQKLLKKVGEPTEVYKRNGNLCGVSYTINLSDSNLRTFLSVSNVVGGFRREKESTEEN